MAREDTRMELVTYTDADLALTAAVETDPVVMKELGGPRLPADIPEIHRRRLEGIANGDWWLKIVPEPQGPAAGTIGIWPATWQGREIHETGWTLLPAFQGQGLASAALELLLARARPDPRFSSLHAFPGISNGPSNGLCRKFGFTKLEACDIEYAGRVLRCNHWELGLRD
jgi:RimJ/RimL family protein N-acetyltransferase